MRELWRDWLPKHRSSKVRVLSGGLWHDVLTLTSLEPVDRLRQLTDAHIRLTTLV
jgi:hypothetical protein